MKLLKFCKKECISVRKSAPCSKEYFPFWKEMEKETWIKKNSYYFQQIESYQKISIIISHHYSANRLSWIVISRWMKLQNTLKINVSFFSTYLRNTPIFCGKKTPDSSVSHSFPASTKLENRSSPHIYYPPKYTVRISEVLQEPAVNIRGA